MKNQVFCIVFLFFALEAKTDHVPTGYHEETTLPSGYLPGAQEVSNYEVKTGPTSGSELAPCVDQRPSCCQDVPADPDCPNEMCSLSICVAPSEEPIPTEPEGESPGYKPPNTYEPPIIDSPPFLNTLRLGYFLA